MLLMKPGIFVSALTLLLAPAALAAPWVEFADFEHQGKCGSVVNDATSPETIATWDQERLDLLYACSKAGPMPDGFMNGKVVFAAGGNFDNFIQTAGKLAVPISKDKFKKFAETLWKGKHFYKQDKALLNKIGPNVEPLLGVDIKGQMRFPAKVYCGQSLLDSRRESIIIDYAFTDTVKIDGKSPYNDAIDWIAAGQVKTGKRGLAVRDEIRMVKPGFYLGRAYMDRVFLLNFILSTSQPAGGDDTCFPGYAQK
jgi:hypothetical protein